MKKIYYVGDMLNYTGPAMVNKSYYPYLKEKMHFCFSNNKLFRTIHYIIHICFVKSVIISGYSKLNILLLKLAKLLNKRTFYLMHGFIYEEVKYQNIDNKQEKINREYELLNKVENIICVSEFFSKYLKKIYPEFNKKIIYVNNGIDINISEKRVQHDTFTIMSVGGGVSQKNNLKVCQAISKLNIDIKFIVVGSDGMDGNKIKEYPFVKYYESLPHNEVLEKMSESDLYIQNSYFETFGLAIMESLECGCDLLISKNVGALSVLKNVTDNDIINDVDNIDEIALKIENKINNSTKKISYDKNACSNKERCNQLLKIVR